MYSKFSNQHSFARRNGYAGSYEEYIHFKHKMYATGCKRCGIKPMKFQDWFDAQ